MTHARKIVFIVPARIEQPISWRAKPGWFGSRYWIKWTDGSYRWCSRQTIIDAGDGR